MRHREDSHLLNFLKYSRDYRVGHVTHHNSSCDRMESHWIANDLHMLSQQKLGKAAGLLETDWGLGEDEDAVSVQTRHTSSPTDERGAEHLHTLFKSGSGPAEVWLRNISMIMGCSSCSTSEFETFSSRSASTSSSVTVTTSATDLLANPDSTDNTGLQHQNTPTRLEGASSRNIDLKLENVKQKDTSSTPLLSEDTCFSPKITFQSVAKEDISDSYHAKAMSPVSNHPLTDHVVQEHSQEPATKAPGLPSMQQSETADMQSSLPFDLHRGRTSCDLRSPCLQSPLGQILLAHASKGKLPIQISRQNSPIKMKNSIMKRPKKTKIWRRKKRIKRSNSSTKGRETDSDVLNLTGILPDTPVSSKLKRPGYLCFTPMYDSRYDKWKRKRCNSKNSKRRAKSRVRTAMDMVGSGDDESDGSSESDDGHLWPSPGASTTVDPRSTTCTSDSDRETTDIPSSRPVSPPQEQAPEEDKAPSARPSSSANGQGVNLAIIALPINQPAVPVTSTCDKSTETSGKELKFSKTISTLPTATEQTATTKDKAGSGGNKATQTSSEPKENLAKKLKAILKRKPASTTELEGDRVAGKDGVASIPGRTNVWLTESLAVSSIGPPPSSDLQTARPKPSAAPEKPPKKPEKCSRAERPTRKVTLHEILRFLPNIGLTSEEPSQECSHDLTQILPSGRRPDVTLCRSCICKMAMAQTASKPVNDGRASRGAKTGASNVLSTNQTSDCGLSNTRSAYAMPLDQKPLDSRTKSLGSQPTVPKFKASVILSSATSEDIVPQKGHKLTSLPQNKPD